MAESDPRHTSEQPNPAPEAADSESVDKTAEKRVEEHVFPDEFDVTDPAMTGPESGTT